MATTIPLTMGRTATGPYGPFYRFIASEGREPILQRADSRWDDTGKPCWETVQIMEVSATEYEEAASRKRPERGSP